MDIYLEKDKISESRSADGRETNKFRFKEGDGDVHNDMVVDLDPQLKVSWKQMLLGKGVSVQEEGFRYAEVDIVEDLEFLEGDIKKSMVNGIPAIEMSGLPGFGILEVGGGLVDKVAKLDFNTDKKIKGCFARMTVFVDLDRPSVS
ncbi:hypothetical protein CXB51_020674 [Gossypium anomalum]|uniref:Uncharacterized protein n=1 Tax=Gossypium anomalum TaxID=47600 RepID=A0A8J5YDD2_9ROSI|nr:hypothetical protein CXB51_020674 [Gossypium anomalum]